MILVEQSFMRGIKSHDLERYLTFYACRIRKLAPILSSRDKMFSIEFFQALGLVTGHRPGALTPRLKELLWPSPDAIGKWLGGDSRLLTPHINLFLSETVSSFTAFDCGAHLQSTYLTYIIDHLPNLEDLDLRALAPRRIEGILYKTLRFDTTQIMARDPTVTPQKQYPRLRVLHVGDSPISSPLRVVAFIKAYFPRLEELHTTVSGPETPDMTMAERRWLAVVRGAWKTTHQ
jgi:hypothetical protein